MANPASTHVLLVVTAASTLLVAALIAPMACSPSTSSASTPPSGMGSASATIGPSGGTLTGGGATLFVPPHALSASGTTLTLAWGPPSFGGYAFDSELFQFGPSGTTFAAPALAALPVAGDPQAAAFYWSNDQGSYSELPVTVANGLAYAQVGHFSAGFVAADSASFSTSESYWSVTVAGQSLRVPCPELDQDFTKPGANTFFVTQSASTGVVWGVDFPKTASTIVAGAAPGTYALLAGGPQAAASPSVFGFQMMVPAGSSVYETEAQAPSASAFHRITKIQLVSSTSTAMTFRIWGVFQGPMSMPGVGKAPASATGAWTLLVTYPAIPGAFQMGPPDAGVATDAGRGTSSCTATGVGCDAGMACPTGATCGASCAPGQVTSVSGIVYDPAGKNPLYNVAVYVPSGPLQALPRGVPQGASACSCSALFPTPALASTSTAANGTFTLSGVPTGSHVPLVLQIGKWRRLISVAVSACVDNPQPDGSLALPSTVAKGDTDDNIPDLAVSTGAADTLECLPLRVGLAASEYVAGAGMGGHVHLFGGGTTGQSGVGAPESPGSGGPPSYMSLWGSVSQLMPYDAVLLSCEGGETYHANPAGLEAYLDAGGRVYASHFHYSWFSGPLVSKQSYVAPTDWGSNLATWSADGTDSQYSYGTIETTLTAGGSFPKGQAFNEWLSLVNALGTNGAPQNELAMFQTRSNASVDGTNTASQAWIDSDPSSGAPPGQTYYFSFDTPVHASLGSNGEPAYCGRAVFSDLHVTSGAQADQPPAPGGCAMRDLSPQEKALEFMMFDLSSCVLPDSAQP